MTRSQFAHRLPHFFSRRLFGDRSTHGLVPVQDDKCWLEWQSRYHEFYNQTQHSGIGSKVNGAGYKVLEHFDLDEKKVLEIGPGSLTHLEYWQGKPTEFVAVDIDRQFLRSAEKTLSAAGVPYETRLSDRSSSSIPARDEEFDVLMTFFSLEHLYPLELYLDEMFRVLKPGGSIVGAIPLEGGLAWGAGRYLTSRRWLLKHTSIDPDKIICWEHPNFADEIFDSLTQRGDFSYLDYWPLKIHSMDLNLVLRFVINKLS